MLFTTAAFAFLFLPVTWAGFFVLGRWHRDAAATWLFAASLFFYAWWMPVFTLLLLASIAANFACGLGIQAARASAAPRRAKALLTLGVTLDLAALGWFKYANFFVGNFNAVTGLSLDIGHVVLPIGISFYTFTQIAFLVDTWLGKVGETRASHYGLFVTYFPHLVAGPVLHHAQMMPQFADPSVYRVQGANIAGGIGIFALGLFKKIVIADGIAAYADAVFHPVDAGALPGAGEAWIGALAYTLQLYFDFSGYSDMAIGLSRMFNIRLPFNFDSPYKASSIADFWRRWHISLSTFLRDYLYVPLGGNRRSAVRRYVNLAITMVLGGLWHGASWSFVFWGALHGTYLIVNHGWRAAVGATRCAALERHRAYRWICWLLTMLAVVLAWVFFRAETLLGAWRMVQAMTGWRTAADAGVLLWNAGLPAERGVLWCVVLAAMTVALANNNVIGLRLIEALRGRPLRCALVGGFAATACTTLVLVNAARDSVSAFIYFNF